MKYFLGLLVIILFVLYPVTAEQNADLSNNSPGFKKITDADTVLDKLINEISTQLTLIQDENKKSVEALSEAGISGDVANNLLDSKLNNLTYAHSSLVISPEVIVTAASPSKYTGLIGTNLSYQPETRYVIGQKKPVITDLFPLEEGFYGISVSYPIFSKNKEYLGYTDVTIRPEEFLRQIIIPITESAGYEALIIQKNGTTIFENNAEEVGKNVLTDPMYDTPELKNLANNVVNNEFGTANYTFWNVNWNNKIPRQVIWKTLKLDDQEWRVGIIKNLNESDNIRTTTSNQSIVSGNLNTSISEMMRFVQDAADFARKNGQKEACAVFNNLSGPYVSGEKYIFGYDMKGNALALPYQQGLIGMNRMNLTDVNGLAIMPAMIETAREGGGYLYFVYPNNANGGQNQLKIFRIEPVDSDWFIASGVFLPWVKPELDQESINSLILRVKNAVSHSEKVGKEQAVKDFNNLNGTYADEENYIFAYDYNGTTLALPFQADLIGTNRKDYTDTYGSRIIEREIQTAKDDGGFVYVVYFNPKTHKNELKLCYVLPTGDNWLVGSGIYTGRGLEV
jgi:hypothetical protein